MPSQPHRFHSVLVATTIAAATVLTGQTRQPVTPADYGEFERSWLSPEGALARRAGSPTASTARTARTSCGCRRCLGRRRRSSRSDRSRLSRPTPAGRPTASATRRRKKKSCASKEADPPQARHVEARLGRDDDGRRHRVVRVQRERYPSGDEALRAGAQGRARARRRRQTTRRRARRSSSATGDGPRHDLRQRVGVRLAGQGRLLAITISAEDKTGNGVQLFDPETGALRVLDSAAASTAA